VRRDRQRDDGLPTVDTSYTDLSFSIADDLSTGIRDPW